MELSSYKTLSLIKKGSDICILHENSVQTIIFLDLNRCLLLENNILSKFLNIYGPLYTLQQLSSWYNLFDKMKL